MTENKCVWNYFSEEPDNVVYRTECDKGHRGGAIVRGYKFCPFCGGEIHLSVEPSRLVDGTIKPKGCDSG